MVGMTVIYKSLYAFIGTVVNSKEGKISSEHETILSKLVEHFPLLDR
jgi:hypothetical protein